MKSSTYFHMKTKILADFQNYISVPLIELAISRTENEFDTLSQILLIIPREDRVDTEFFKNV